MLLAFALLEQLVQLLLEIVIVQEIVKFHPGLHQINHVFLVALLQNVLSLCLPGHPRRP